MRNMLVGALVCGLIPWAQAQPKKAGLEIRMATLAPQDSAWYRVMEKMGQDWKNISGGNVKLSILPGGVAGDEPDCVRRLRQHSLESAGLSGVGLGDIDQGVAALQIPMMFDSYEELDYVRDRVAPKMEERIARQGFLVLYWGDAGWVQFFSTKKVTNLADLRKLKLFTWGGDPTEEKLWTSNGFRVVPLAATDIPFQVRTGGIDVVTLTALYAETSGIYAWTHYVCDVKWAPLIGATVIAKDVWAKIPADQQAQMLAAARKWGAALKDDVRSQGDRAIAAMQKGIPGKRASALEVVHIEGAALAEWRATTEKIWNDMKGKMVPADLFDEVRRLRDEYRAKGRP